MRRLGVGEGHRVASVLAGQRGRDLEQVRRWRASPSARVDEMLERVGVDRERARRRARARSRRRPFRQVAQLVGVERLEAEQRGAREQRAGEREERVLGGRADEDEQPLLDVGQQRVLLGSAEAVHLVEEQDRALPVLGEAAPGARRDLPDVLHARAHRRERLERLAGGAGDSRAMVVLPVPGGPHRITDDSRSASMRTRSGLPEPSRCCWPTTSSSDRGRSRAASGARRARRSSTAGAEQVGHRPMVRRPGATRVG